ncbi:MAG: 2,3,4,5-tetrahydropyridine-2,6-dicarboxylate N-succinyltransferase, partial [Bdellovibrionales bacterium]|nr:2,3,4,5-tetrahydropyridine-2,6-dicarboxylate N-succinyltransferase [Bdellovibrionales bacterium]NQZ19092.1 2,3,4,5-tetrahydropyridine-2,6-dicarboxylate N-succinyltransferase [Bdellovibrionales bacterium]
MQNQIDEIFELPNDQLDQHGAVIEEAIAQLNSGSLRVSEKNDNGEWIVNQWVKKAILLFFRYKKMEKMDNPPFSFYDKIPLKQWSGDEKVRVVPQALARYGSFIDEGAVLMPSYINIGAYVGKGTMVDTWAPVGSCASIGANV